MQTLQLSKLLRITSTGAFVAYGLILLILNFGVEVDDYHSYKKLFTGEEFNIAQPMFSVVARTLNIFGYDFGRAFLGLFILFVLAYWLLKCDRNWLLALIVFLWYAVPILTIHIRLGFAISLFCIFFSSLRDRNFRLTNAKLLILVATHYSMLLVKFINDFFHNRYVSRNLL